MPDDRTQEATPFRRRRARERGQIARTRELPSALALLTIVVMLGGYAEKFVFQWRELLSQGLAMSQTQNPENLLDAMERMVRIAGGWAFPCLAVGWVLSIVGNVVQGGFVFSTAGLTPSLMRLSPATNIQKRFSVGGVSNFLKSIIPMAVIAYLVFGIVARDWNWILFSTMQTVRVSTAWLMGRLYELAWKAGAVFLAWSGIDYLLQRTQLSRQLRMTRQEVVQENKDNIGNPEIKRRIRRIQVQMRRRMMMRDVQKAAVVITNPTEFAIALKYQPGVTRAPVVVAKGRNLLARQIRQEAVWHNIPIIENPPLAHALYRAVQVGQVIPPALYVAVAEILAFIFRAQARTRAMGATKAAGAASSARRKD